ncbi:hypothetical protein NIA69_06215 [Gemmiger formicilis]|nr:hypothetical protein [Gemmiger formicilis]
MTRLIINYGSNVLLGSVWKAMLYGKGYLYYFTSGLVKNTTMLPIEVFLTWVVLNAAVKQGLDRKFIHKDNDKSCGSLHDTRTARFLFTLPLAK